MDPLKNPKKFTGNFKNLVISDDIIIRPVLKNYTYDMDKDLVLKLEKTIKKLCKEYKIKIDKIRFKSPVGRAWINERHIKIPVIKGIVEFMVALHEIAHCVNGFITPKCIDEYSAEIWAIKKAEELGIDSSPYHNMSRAYVLRNLAECHCEGNIDVEELSEEIKDYVRIYEPDITEWKGCYVEVFDEKNRVIINKTKIIEYENN